MLPLCAAVAGCCLKRTKHASDLCVGEYIDEECEKKKKTAGVAFINTETVLWAEEFGSVRNGKKKVTITVGLME